MIIYILNIRQLILGDTNNVSAKSHTTVVADLEFEHHGILTLKTVVYNMTP